MMVGKISVGCVHVNAYIPYIIKFAFFNVLHIGIKLEFFSAGKDVPDLTGFPVNKDTGKSAVPCSDQIEFINRKNSGKRTRGHRDILIKDIDS